MNNCRSMDYFRYELFPGRNPRRYKDEVFEIDLNVDEYAMENEKFFEEDHTRHRYPMMKDYFHLEENFINGIEEMIAYLD